MKRLKKYLRKVHWGDKRRDRKPYLHHLYRVADMVFNLTGSHTLYKIALFHDSIELHDSMELRKFLKKEKIFKEVLILSQSGGETYMQYLDRIRSYKKLIVIKIMDMIDNACDSPTNKQKLKYREGLRFLLRYY